MYNLNNNNIYKTNKIPYLNGIRGIAIILVLIGHINLNYFKIQWINHYLKSGGIGVTIFFVLSGFLITTLFIKEEQKDGRIKIHIFWVRRFFRIVPLAIFYISFIFLLNKYYKLNINYSFFICSILFINNISGIISSYHTKNSILLDHYWSLSVEEQFYLIYPIIFKYFRKNLNIILILFILSINLFRIFITSSFIFLFESIAIGSILSLYLKYIFQIKNIFKFSKHLFLISLILIFIFISFNFIFSNLFLSMSISIFILSLLLNGNKIVFYIFNNFILESFGLISYSLYIWQQLFFVNNNFRIQNINISILILFFVSIISYNFIEKPFNTYLKNNNFEK